MKACLISLYMRPIWPVHNPDKRATSVLNGKIVGMSLTGSIRGLGSVVRTVSVTDLASAISPLARQIAEELAVGPGSVRSIFEWSALDSRFAGGMPTPRVGSYAPDHIRRRDLIEEVNNRPLYLVQQAIEIDAEERLRIEKGFLRLLLKA